MVFVCSRDSIGIMGGSKNVLVYMYIDFGLNLCGWIWFTYSWSACLCVFVCIRMHFTDLEFSLCQTGMGVERCRAGGGRIGK